MVKVIAISNSQPRWLVRLAVALTCHALAFFAQAAPGEPNLTNSPAYFAIVAEKNLSAARTRYLADTNNTEAAWHLGRACFDRAEFAANSAQRASLANEGIAVGRTLVANAPKLAAAHYYLAMNLGQLARTKSVGALALVSEMEPLFTTAAALDAPFDFAGANRCLGLLYRDAPVWPASLGSRVKARQHLLRAAEIAPQYPENHLNLVETFLKWSEPNNAQRAWKNFTDTLPVARTNLTGQAWAASWADWEYRRAAAEVRLHELRKNTK